MRDGGCEGLFAACWGARDRGLPGQTERTESRYYFAPPWRSFTLQSVFIVCCRLTVGLGAVLDV